MKRCLSIAVLVSTLCVLFAWGAAERGLTVREAVIYISPDSTSAKLSNLDRGREVILLEKSGNWLHVLASVTEARDINGWVLDKGILRKTTPNGDRILFGEAIDSESEAARRGGRKGADTDAMRLYAWMLEYFPNSPLAGESMYRAADVRWQLEKAEAMTRRSYKERDPDMRPQIDEDTMKKVIKKFSGTKWADLAAFHLIDNKLCGDWEGRSKCPERESDIYIKYADEHPQSPAAPEALYNAAWRKSTLIQIYKTEGQQGKSAESKTRALALTQRVISQYPQTDWAARSQALAYKLEQNIPTYGNSVE